MKPTNPSHYTFCSSKMFLSSCFLFLLICCHTAVQAQAFDRFTAFGEVTADEINMKAVPFDKDADAVIIHHLARSDYNDQHNLVTEHRIKIKILNEKGIANGDIHIRFNHKDGFEFLSGIEATVKTFEANGQFTTSTISNKNIYTIKLNEYFSESRFALPNVKAGSILEYRYTSNKKHYGGLRDWEFQSYLPTITSFYRLAILPNYEFTYKIYKLPELPIFVDNKGDGYVTYKMDNIPALQDEAYMDSRRDNLQHVTFQMSAFNRNGFKDKYLTKWDDAAYELLSTPELGGQLNKSLAGTDAFTREVKTIADLTERTKTICEFVHRKMSWNGFYGKYSINGIKQAWEKGTGSNSEINMIFVNLLLQSNVPACLLMANDRDDGKIDISYPFLDQFNKLVAYVMLPTGNLVIDASDANTPINLVPLSLLNTYGYKIDKKNKGLMLIEDARSYTNNIININGSITADGDLDAQVIVQSKDYARLDRASKYKEMGAAKFIHTFYSDGYTDLKTDELEISNLKNDSLPLIQQMHFIQSLNTSGDFIFANYHLFTGFIKNPFISSFRFSDINFGSPQSLTIIQMLKVPEDFVADFLPKNTAMRTADTSVAFSRYINLENGMLSTKFHFELNRGFFIREEYEMLKDFYRRMFLLLDEQIILKKKQ